MSAHEWTDRDIDTLMSGRTPQDAELALLVPAVHAMRVSLLCPTSSEQADRMGALLAAEVKHTPTTRPWVRRTAFAGIGALALSFAAVGAASADESAPGDALYGLDRALEVIGLGAGGVQERVDEATRLSDEGDDEGAIEFLSQELGDDGVSNAPVALMNAAATIRANGSESSADVHAAVADMLEWMAQTELTGRDFGQGVADHARMIGTKAEADADAVDVDESDTSGDAPGKSGDAPGKSGDAPGKSGDAHGKSATSSGKSTVAGKPEATGKPVSSGKPSGTGKP